MGSYEPKPNSRLCHHDVATMSKPVQFCRESVFRLLARDADRRTRVLGIGVNSGMVVAGARGDRRQTSELGDAVNIAARLSQAVLSMSLSPGLACARSSQHCRHVRNAAPGHEAASAKPHRGAEGSGDAPIGID